VAWCPDLDIASQGKTIEESLANLKEAIELHFEDEEATTPQKEIPSSTSKTLFINKPLYK